MRMRRFPSFAGGMVLIMIGSLMGQAASQSGGPVVRIESGEIVGTAEGAAGEVRVFRGIPYAEPPVGEMRWKPPRPVKPWTKSRACTAFGAACPQPTALMTGNVGQQSEDCLYLNVWTAARRGEKRPVMVWIHGGGFTTGSGGMSYYNGEHFARAGVVLVTINYRLGPFGFFAHPVLSKESKHGVSGNYGLLDMIAALEWVKRNIAAFGGDPNCVTIFGESAGAAAVTRLMVCPQAKGLFHRVIAQSGGAYGRARYLRKNNGALESMESLGERLARELAGEDAGDVIAALRHKSAEEILKASNPAQGLFGKGTKFGPVVDGWLLTDDPGALWEHGRMADVPLLLGTNADEGSVFVQQLPIRRAAGYRLTVQMFFGDDAGELMRLFPVSGDDDVKGALSRLITDAAFVAPARMHARAMRAVKSPAWLYHFTVKPRTSLPNRRGTFHAMEIPFVFGTLPRIGVNDEDRGLSRQMMSYWVNFARGGDPNGRDIDGKVLPPWPRYETSSDKHAELGHPVKVESGLHKASCDTLTAMQRNRMKSVASRPAKR